MLSNFLLHSHLPHNTNCFIELIMTVKHLELDN
jgi:hypothetical protein